MAGDVHFTFFFNKPAFEVFAFVGHEASGVLGVLF